MHARWLKGRALLWHTLESDNWRYRRRSLCNTPQQDDGLEVMQWSRLWGQTSSSFLHWVNQWLSNHVGRLLVSRYILLLRPFRWTVFSRISDDCWTAKLGHNLTSEVMVGLLIYHDSTTTKSDFISESLDNETSLGCGVGEWSGAHAKGSLRCHDLWPEPAYSRPLG